MDMPEPQGWEITLRVTVTGKPNNATTIDDAAQAIQALFRRIKHDAKASAKVEAKSRNVRLKVDFDVDGCLL